MRRAHAPIAVLTADIVGSSRYGSADRRKLDEVIHKAFADVERRFRWFDAARALEEPPRRAGEGGGQGQVDQVVGRPLWFARERA